MGERLAAGSNLLWLPRGCSRLTSVRIIEDLFEAEFDEACNIAFEVIPDIAAALDRLIPKVTGGGDRMTIRRYVLAVDEAAHALTSMPARNAAVLPPAAVVYELLRQDRVELPWVAPTPDGRGIVTVLVDRLRVVVAGLPQHCGRARVDIDEQRFAWFMSSIAAIDLEQRCVAPLRRAMTILGLTSADVAAVMGVRRQAVDKWLLTGAPSDRVTKIGVIAEIADILRYRLRDGMPPVVVRRQAAAYGDRSMLEVIADDDHDWLLDDVRHSFDFSRVA